MCVIASSDHVQVKWIQEICMIKAKEDMIKIIATVAYDNPSTIPSSLLLMLPNSIDKPKNLTSTIDNPNNIVSKLWEVMNINLKEIRSITINNDIIKLSLCEFKFQVRQFL